MGRQGPPIVGSMSHYELYTSSMRRMWRYPDKAEYNEVIANISGLSSRHEQLQLQPGQAFRESNSRTIRPWSFRESDFLNG